jgi:hypothetical protein
MSLSSILNGLSFQSTVFIDAVFDLIYLGSSARRIGVGGEHEGRLSLIIMSHRLYSEHDA